MAGCLVRDPSSWLSQVPLDVVQYMQQTYVQPCVVLPCRTRNGDEVTRLIALNTLEACQNEQPNMDPNPGWLYSMAAHASWPSTSAMVVRSSPSKDGPRELLEIDYNTGIQGAPLWAHITGVSQNVMPGVCASLGTEGDHHWLIPHRDEMYLVCNSHTGAHRPTSLVFGSRTPGWGSILLSAPDYEVPGQAILGTQSGSLLCYSAYSDAVTEFGSGLDRTCNMPLTALHTQPRTGLVLTAHGNILALRDLRTPSSLAWQYKMSRMMWASSAFVTETLFTSWNALVRTRTGQSMQQVHCSQIDMRAPASLIDAPEWTLPATHMPLWATRIDRCANKLCGRQ